MSDLIKRPDTKYTPEAGQAPEPVEIESGDYGITYSKEGLLELLDSLYEETVSALSHIESELKDIAITNDSELFKTVVSSAVGNVPVTSLSYTGYLIASSSAGESSSAMSSLFEEKSISAWGDVRVFSAKILYMVINEISNMRSFLETVYEGDAVIPPLYESVGEFRIQTEKLRRISSATLSEQEIYELSQYGDDPKKVQVTITGALDDMRISLESNMSVLKSLAATRGTSVSGNYIPNVELMEPKSDGLIGSILGVYKQRIESKQRDAVREVLSRNESLIDSIEDAEKAIANIRVMQLANTELENLGGIIESDVNEVVHTASSSASDQAIRSNIGLDESASAQPILLIRTEIADTSDFVGIDTFTATMESILYGDSGLLDGQMIAPGTISQYSFVGTERPVRLDSSWGENKETAGINDQYKEGALSYSSGRLILDVAGFTSSYSLTGSEVVDDESQKTIDENGSGLYWIYATLNSPEDGQASISARVYDDSDEGKNRPGSAEAIVLGLWNFPSAGMPGKFMSSAGSEFVEEHAPTHHFSDGNDPIKREDVGIVATHDIVGMGWDRLNGDTTQSASTGGWTRPSHATFDFVGTGQPYVVIEESIREGDIIEFGGQVLVDRPAESVIVNMSIELVDSNFNTIERRATCLNLQRSAVDDNRQAIMKTRYTCEQNYSNGRLRLYIAYSIGDPVDLRFLAGTSSTPYIFLEYTIYRPYTPPS